MSFRRPSAAKWRSAVAICTLLLASIFATNSFAQTLPTAQQVASQINVGWNLGNTLEANCGETAWGIRRRTGCSNFDGRTVTVGGVARTCGQLPLTRSADGYYYFAVTAGTYAWASLYVW